MNCKNCGHLVDGNFCSHCGQNTRVDKINFSNFLSELSGSVFQVNKGFFYTLKQLFIRPGHSIREYLHGKRKRHFKPIAYVLILSTIYFVISQLTGNNTLVGDVFEGYANAGGTELKKPFFMWFAKNYAYTVLTLLPIFTLASYLAFFKAGFNYLEHFVLNAYITGQQAIFYATSLVVGLVIGDQDIMTFIAVGVSVSYLLIVFWQFFSNQSRIGVVFRTIMTYFIYLFLLVSVFFSILAFIKTTT